MTRQTARSSRLDQTSENRESEVILSPKEITVNILIESQDRHQLNTQVDLG